MCRLETTLVFFRFVSFSHFNRFEICLFLQLQISKSMVLNTRSFRNSKTVEGRIRSPFYSHLFNDWRCVDGDGNYMLILMPIRLQNNNSVQLLKKITLRKIDVVWRQIKWKNETNLVVSKLMLFLLYFPGFFFNHFRSDFQVTFTREEN